MGGGGNHSPAVSLFIPQRVLGEVKSPFPTIYFIESCRLKMRRFCLFLAFLGLTVAQPAKTISKEAATTTNSTAFPFDFKLIAPDAGTNKWQNKFLSVSFSLSVLPVWSAENKTTNSKVPANGIAGLATERPVGGASKSGSSSGKNEIKGGTFTFMCIF